MNEEEKRKYEAFQYWIQTNTEKGVTTIPDSLCLFIVNLIKSLQKENEELKNDYENLNNSVVVKNYYIKNSIPIQKVKDKIEELKQEKKKYGNCLIEMYEDELVNRDIKILQELLEAKEVE